MAFTGFKIRVQVEQIPGRPGSFIYVVDPGTRRVSGDGAAGEPEMKPRDFCEALLSVQLSQSLLVLPQSHILKGRTGFKSVALPQELS